MRVTPIIINTPRDRFALLQKEVMSVVTSGRTCRVANGAKSGTLRSHSTVI